MNFTFGITTYANNDQRDFTWRERMRMMCDSIRKQNIPNYEIIIAGGPFVKEGRHSGSLHNKSDIVHVPFDEEATPDIPLRNSDGKDVDWFYEQNNIKTGGWITKKKNLMVEKAKYENMVIMHDYCALMPGWQEGQLKYKEEKTKNMKRKYRIEQKRLKKKREEEIKKQKKQDKINRKKMIIKEGNYNLNFI